MILKIEVSLRATEGSVAISYNKLSLRGAQRRGNLNFFARDCFAPLGLAMTSEGIFYAPRNDIIKQLQNY